MTSEIIDAVDGRLLTDKNILKHYSETPLYSPSYPFKVNKGEVGCFLSFRKAWQKIVDQKLSAGLIFEDDVSLNPDTFNESLTSALKWIDEYGYIQFQVRDIPKNSKSIKSYQGIHLLKPMPTLLRCSAQLVSYSTAKKLLEITKKFDIGFIYKTSFDKANRTSLKGQRGAGLEASLPVFDKIKKELNVPILTDIHNAEQCSLIKDHVDVLQIPAFLCRQTDLLMAAAKTGKIVKVKKGQKYFNWQNQPKEPLNDNYYFLKLCKFF